MPASSGTKPHQDDVSSDGLNNKSEGEQHSSIQEKRNAPVSGITKRKNWKLHSRLQVRWEHMFERLSKFKEEHGHCRVPNRYEGDPGLGAWVSTQRRQYKILTSGGSETTPMTPERASKLESIGFVWETRDPRHVPWERRFEQLCEYKEKYGNCSVPVGFADNIQLSHWVSTQRQEHKNMRDGRASRLTKQRIELLEGIGFVWEAQRGGPRRKKITTESSKSKLRVKSAPRAAGKTAKRKLERPNAAIPPFSMGVGSLRGHTPPAVPTSFLLQNFGGLSAHQQDSLMLSSTVGRKTAAILMSETFGTHGLSKKLPPSLSHPSVSGTAPTSASVPMQQLLRRQQQQQQQKQQMALSDEVSITVHPKPWLDDVSWLGKAVTVANRTTQPTVSNAFLPQSALSGALRNSHTLGSSAGSSALPGVDVASLHGESNAIQNQISAGVTQPPNSSANLSSEPAFLDTSQMSTTSAAAGAAAEMPPKSPLYPTPTGREDNQSLAATVTQRTAQLDASQQKLPPSPRSLIRDAPPPPSVLGFVGKQQMDDIDTSTSSVTLHNTKTAPTDTRSKFPATLAPPVPPTESSRTASSPSRGGIFDDAEEDADINAVATAYLSKSSISKNTNTLESR